MQLGRMTPILRIGEIAPKQQLSHQADSSELDLAAQKTHKKHTKKQPCWANSAPLIGPPQLQGNKNAPNQVLCSNLAPPIAPASFVQNPPKSWRGPKERGQKNRSQNFCDERRQTIPFLSSFNFNRCVFLPLFGCLQASQHIYIHFII